MYLYTYRIIRSILICKYTHIEYTFPHPYLLLLCFDLRRINSIFMKNCNFRKKIVKCEAYIQYVTMYHGVPYIQYRSKIATHIQR